ncbi:MAG: isochorismatase family protein [Synergistaceae bacterium]|nr:isochorismatase family protein [Synergistaceae bacterium]
MGEKSRALVVIDPQNDFCDRNGSLYVDGAEDDIVRLADHIGRFGGEYSDILVSLDSHDAVAIFHPKFWADGTGGSPAPYTAISASDLASGRWRPARAAHIGHADRMFAAMEKKNVPSLMIWPEHCVVSTWGHGIAQPLLCALAAWRETSGAPVRYVFKGENPYTEMYSIFEGIDDSWPDAAFNENLYSRLAAFGTLVFAGEALSHCVEASVASYLSRGAPTGQKIHVLSDCTSCVPGFDRNASAEKLSRLGAEFILSR